MRSSGWDDPPEFELEGGIAACEDDDGDDGDRVKDGVGGGDGDDNRGGIEVSFANPSYWLKTRALTTWPFCQPWACRDAFSLRILPM